MTGPIVEASSQNAAAAPPARPPYFGAVFCITALLNITGDTGGALCISFKCCFMVNQSVSDPRKLKQLQTYWDMVVSARSDKNQLNQ